MLELIQCAFIGICVQIIKGTNIFIAVIKTGMLNGGFVWNRDFFIWKSKSLELI